MGPFHALPLRGCVAEFPPTSVTPGGAVPPVRAPPPFSHRKFTGTLCLSRKGVVIALLKDGVFVTCTGCHTKTYGMAGSELTETGVCRVCREYGPPDHPNPKVYVGPIPFFSKDRASVNDIEAVLDYEDIRPREGQVWQRLDPVYRDGERLADRRYLAVTRVNGESVTVADRDGRVAQVNYGAFRPQKGRGMALAYAAEAVLPGQLWASLHPRDVKKNERRFAWVEQVRSKTATVLSVWLDDSFERTDEPIRTRTVKLDAFRPVKGRGYELWKPRVDRPE